MSDDEDEEEKQKRIDRLVDHANATLDAALENLTLTRDALAELNSRFPATRAFLAGKGVQNVMELSPEDREAFMAFLKAERDRLYGTSN